MKKLLSIIVALILCVSLVLFTGCHLLQQGESAYEIAVRNGYTGSEEDWLKTLQGEPGEKGEEGGYLGEVVTVTAYDIAVDNGFEGSEQEWLESLKGDKGETGDKGDKGDSGNVTGVEDTHRQVISQSLLSTVSITVTHTVSTGKESFAGSGVIYQLDKEAGTAYIITNYHVAYYVDSEDNNKIAGYIGVSLYGAELSSQQIKAEYIGGAMTYDIAVLKITSDTLKTYPCNAVDIEYDITVGQTVHIVGNPSGGGISVTEGVVSVDREQIEMLGADNSTNVKFPVVRTDAPINGGNSGGGMYNYQGKLVGIVNAKTVSEKIEGMGYAIPCDVAIAVADNIIDYCDDDNNATISGERYLIGITTGAEESKAVLDSDDNTVRVVETVSIQETVQSGTLAYGKLQKDDIIKSVQINDGEVKEITRYYELGDSMLSVREGNKMSITIERDGEELVVEFTFSGARQTIK